MTLVNKTIFFLICAVIVLSALAYGTVHQPTIAVFYLIVVVMVLLWAFDSVATGKLRFSLHVFQIPVFAIAAYAFVQIIPFGTDLKIAGLAGIWRTISAAPFETQLTALHYLALGMFLSIALAHIDRASRLNWIVNFLIIFGFIFAFFAILQSFLSPASIYGIYERPAPFGSFVNRHNFAAYMEMTMAVPLGMLFVGAVHRDRKLLYLTAIALMGLALLLSGSRGGLIALLAEMIFLVFITTRSKGMKNIIIKAALAIILIGIVVVGSFLIGGESSLTRIADTAKAGDVSTNRDRIWGVTLHVIANNIPFGAGLGAFAQAYTPYDPFNGLERVEQAHNDYLQIVADAGIVGLVIGGLFLFWLFQNGRKNIFVTNIFRKGVATGSLAGIFAILVHSMFDFVIHTTAVSVLFLLLLALLAASGRDYEDDIRDFDTQPSRANNWVGNLASISERQRRRIG